MRVLYLVNSEWPRLRGAEKVMLSIIQRLCARGDDVIVAAPPGSAVHGAAVAIGAQTVLAEFGPLGTGLGELRALLARRGGPDVTVGMSVFPLWVTRVHGLLGSSRRFAHVTIDPSSNLPIAAAHMKGALRRARNLIMKRESRRIETIFVPSRAVARELRQLGVSTHTTVLGGLLDREVMRPLAPEERASRRRDPRIGTAAFLEPLKAIHNLIGAFSRVKRDHPEVTLRIAGEGPSLPGLEAAARETGIASSTEFIGYTDDVAAFMHSLDIYVTCSLSEARSQSTLQAMACGVPVIATAVGGMAESVIDGKTGLLIPPDDEGALVEAINRLLDDQELARSLSEHGLELVADPFYDLESNVTLVIGALDRGVDAPTM